MTSANLTSRQIQLLSAVCEVMKANVSCFPLDQTMIY